ncbi:MAG: phosphate signaling complex protein PhoU [Defluviitaleaceae bacterium]|nr:phosphate signaling complex protein PhoU [Defluviitaleaceae bacterium]
MSRTKYDRQLQNLNDTLIEMAGVVESAINDATRALVEKDIALAQKVIDHDDDIDSFEKEIEKHCIDIILRQQPVAGDLRLISAILKMITDLERIGDHATDISEMTTFLAKTEYIKKLVHIPEMAQVACTMLKEGIDAFIRRDVELAKKVIADDDKVDEIFIHIKEELIELIKQDVSNANQAMDFMMIAKYYERIGDHATNVAEWAEYAVTGTHEA